MADDVLLTGWSNAPFPGDTFTMLDADGVAVSLLGRTLSMDVRAYWGAPDPALIGLDTVTDSSDGIRVLDAEAGTYRIQIDEASMLSAWTAGRESAGADASLVYDLLVFDPDGYSEVKMEGVFTIIAGVSA